MKQYPTIVLTGGGSGGHITPLLPLARALKAAEPGCEIVYIGHKGDSFDRLKLSTSDFDFLAFVRAGKFRRYHGESFFSHLFDVKTLIFNVRDFFRVISATMASLKILRKVKPDIVFSKGGFVVVPVCIAARILRIPIVTHDSDAVPGMANRIIARWAVVNATGMPPKDYPYPKSKMVFVGIPVEDELEVTPGGKERLMSELNLPKNAQILLVAGGGNGAKTLNDLLVQIAPTLLNSNLALHIVHLCGLNHEAAVRDNYRAVLDEREMDRVSVIGFSGDFPKYSKVADLIISRAGATVIAEYAVQSKACIIIPSPFLAAGHQLKNAQVLADRDAAVVLPNSVTPDELLTVSAELLNNPSRRAELGKHLGTMSRPDAAKKLATIIISNAKPRNA